MYSLKHKNLTMWLLRSIVRSKAETCWSTAIYFWYLQKERKHVQNYIKTVFKIFLNKYIINLLLRREHVCMHYPNTLTKQSAAFNSFVVMYKKDQSVFAYDAYIL